MKERFAVIGHPVAHSLSPVMHAANFKAVGYDGVYGKFDVEPGDVERFVKEKRDEGYLGLNVTVPHKFAVLPLLDIADVSIERYGACNTLKFLPDGRIAGYNTDAIGFVEGLSARGFRLEGKKVLVLGCGGAGSVIATACAYEGAAKILFGDLRRESVEALGKRLAAICGAARGVFAAGGAESCKAAWTDAAKECDLVVNATPAGLHEGDASALPPEAFRPGQFVLDIVPTKTTPPTAKTAAAAGAETADGLEFLVGQGAKSFEIWTGLAADRKAMLAAIRQ